MSGGNDHNAQYLRIGLYISSDNYSSKKNRINLPILSSQIHIVSYCFGLFVCSGLNIILKNDAGPFLGFFKLQKNQASLSNRLLCPKIELNAM